jgi:hypothetical protein
MARSLMLHKGAQRREMDSIRQDDLPLPMGSRHVPIRHATVYDIAKERLTEGGYNVRWEEHSTTPDGMRYFGLLGITNGENSDERERVMGLRNANDQTFGTEGVAGDSVFVCDNLCFSGEIKVGRKHTKHQVDDLPILMDKMVGYLGAAWDNQAERVSCYKERPLSKPEVHDIVCNAMKAGALPTSKIATVLDEYENPTHDDFGPRNLWSLFNAYTEIGKAWNGHSLQDRSIKMVGLLDEFSGHRALKPLKDVEDFAEVAELREVVEVN